MISLLLQGFANLFASGSAATLLLGMVFGMIIGALPGLTATMGIALLLPLTYTVSPEAGLSLLIGIFAGGIYGGSVSAILLKTPGTPAAGATLLDGYPLAQSGNAGKALTVATISSAIGGLIGALTLSFLAPQIARFALLFGPPEYVLLALYGLTMISYVSGKSLVKGYFAGLFGLLIATIGLDPINGFPRFTFGNLNFLNGISLLPVLIGLFAISQALESAETYDEKAAAQAAIKKLGISFKEFIHILPTIIKSAFIGTFVGAIPGTGTDIAAFLSYGEAKRSSKHPEKFGTGVIEGVAAPESGNNGCVNGALIPMFTLGIPGEAATAVVLGGLMVLGLQPGPLLFKDNPQIIYTVFASTITSNLMMLVLGILGARIFAKILSLPKNIITTLIFVFAIVGSYSMRNNLFDVWITIVFGVLGYFMSKAEYPIPPVLLGMILGPMVEANLGRTLLISEGSYSIFVTRPISIFFIVVTIFTVVSSIRKKNKQKDIEFNS
ncbi:tripartite tricarboxylate transporter permease [Petroclostridium sp. X23]|uniref:tripartite tricarboxylate transporter permease n=1 Tax=Petroclostridium sp. X23 TaxID=3045146 RepID=UPI0024AD8792|nr:tripartite tricarboxylate transporter permease [Petroclostridium sp. X23]WHH58030.1 tripartite tricarboxylate transporter permease [Petroclostridium sp. X23]